MKRSGQLIIGLVVAVLATAYTMRNVSIAELLDSFVQVEVKYLAMTTLLMVLTYVARTLRWKLLVEAIQPVRAWDLVSPLMVGFMAAVLPARAGEFVRAYLLGKSQNISFGSSFATIVVERLFDMMMLLIMLAWLLVFHSGIFESDAMWSGISVSTLAFQFGLFSLILVVALVAFLYLLAFRREVAIKLVRWCVSLLPEKWQDKILNLVDTFSQGLNVVRQPAALLKVSLTTALVWSLIVLAYYPLYIAYDFKDTSAASLVLLTLMICILITLLPTPAFLGSFNAGVLIALHEIMHEAEVAAVSFGFVAWGINFFVITVGGLYFVLHDHISVRKIVEMEQEN